MIVVDASAVVELLIGSELGAEVERRSSGETLHAPAHLDVEILGALRRAMLRGLMSQHEIAVLIAQMTEIPMQRWPLSPLAARAIEMAASVSAGDAFCVALAEGLDTPLVTCDGRLSRSHGHNATIELLSRI